MTQRSGPNDPSDLTHWLDAGDALAQPDHPNQCADCPFPASNAPTERILAMSAPLSEPIQVPLASRSDRNWLRRRHQSP